MVFHIPIHSGRSLFWIWYYGNFALNVEQKEEKVETMKNQLQYHNDEHLNWSKGWPNVDYININFNISFCTKYISGHDDRGAWPGVGQIPFGLNT